MYAFGLAQLANGAASSRQRYVTPAVVLENSNVALVAFVMLAGPEWIVGGAGGAGGGGAGGRGAGADSICHANEATPLSRPAPSRAFTSKRWEPTASELYVLGLAHVAKEAPSSRQRYETPGVGLENRNVASREVVTLVGLDSMTGVVGGAARRGSIDHTQRAAGLLVSPATATTSKAWRPLLRLAYVTGLVHRAKGARSSRHSYPLTRPFDENRKVAVVSTVGFAGPETIWGVRGRCLEPHSPTVPPLEIEPAVAPAAAASARMIQRVAAS
ncbi:MAG: hypothetical protein RMM28_05450 [Thermoleophilia bacterium]|nr:hypothetical protein [Gaiellaceae bacterium]MDW8338566.1 hypothetical protein [Thermoleophilia bacterium]